METKNMEIEKEIRRRIEEGYNWNTIAEYATKQCRGNKKQARELILKVQKIIIIF